MANLQALRSSWGFAFLGVAIARDMLHILAAASGQSQVVEPSGASGIEKVVDPQRSGRSRSTGSPIWWKIPACTVHLRYPEPREVKFGSRCCREGVDR